MAMKVELLKRLPFSGGRGLRWRAREIIAEATECLQAAGANVCDALGLMKTAYQKQYATAKNR